MTTKTEPTQARIVLGFDGSRDSVNALAWAASEAEARGAHLELISTWEWPTGLGWSGIPSGWNPAHDVIVTLEQAIKELHVAHPDLNVTFNVLEGPPALTLVDASGGAALLVVGTRGHGELVSLLIGSVSQYCVAHAQCPVVVIRSAT